jgi:hypothetical protein
MSPERFTHLIFLLRWTDETVAEVLGCRHYLVAAWTDGRARIPDEVADWMEMLGAAHLVPTPHCWKSQALPHRYLAGEKVPVFESLVWNAVAADLTLADQHLRTIESIHLLGAEPDLASERVVDGSEIDEHGVYRPAESGGVNGYSRA